MKNFKKIQLIKVLPLIWMLLGILIDIWFIIGPGDALIDSDMAEEMVLSNLQNAEHSIISNNWYFSSEIRIINMQWFFRVGLLIFPHSWTYARALGMFLFYCAFISVWYVLTKILDLGEYGLWATAASVWPFGVFYHFWGTFGAHYLYYNLFTLIGFALFWKLKKSLEEDSKKKAVIFGILTFIVAFLVGMQSIRQMLCIYLPLFFGTIIWLLYDIVTTKELKWSDYFCKQFDRIKVLMLAFLTLVANAMGYLVNVLVFSKLYSFEKFQNVSFNRVSEWPWSFYLDEFIQSFGFVNNIKIFSLEGVCSLVGLALGFLVVLCVVRLGVRYKSLDTEKKLMYLICVSGILVDTFSLMYNGRYYEGYWLMCIPYALLLLFVEIKTEHFSLPNMNKLWLYVVILMFTIASFGVIKSAVVNPVKGNEKHAEMAQWLEDNGYKQGMAYFDDASPIIEMTNGDVDMWTIAEIDDEPKVSVVRFLQKIDHNILPSGQVFIILPGMASVNNDNPVILKHKGRLEYEDGLYCIYVMDEFSQTDD